MDGLPLKELYLGNIYNLRKNRRETRKRKYKTVFYEANCVRFRKGTV